MANEVMLKTEAQQIRQTALSALVSGRELLNKSYLSELGQFDLQTLDKFPSEKIDFFADVRIFKVERIVLENKQSMLESITAAYTALGAAGYSVFLLLQSNGSETTVYLGTRGEAERTQGNTAGQLLNETFKGHFAGSLLTQLKGKESEELSKTFSAVSSPSITAITGVPSLSVEEREHFMQGLEHFIDAAEGRKYQALILAEPVSSLQLDIIQAGYESVATQLSPLLKQTLSFGENESENVGLSLSEGISHSFGTSIGLTESKGKNYSISHNKSITAGSSQSDTTAGAGQKAVAVASTLANTAIQVAADAGTAINPLVGIGINLGGGVLSSVLGKSTTEGTNTSNTEGTTKTEGHNENTAKTNTKQETHTTNQNKAYNLNNSTGSSRQVTLEMTDKNIEQMLKKVDQQLERVNEARRYGGWNSAAYFISDNTAASQSIASIFLGLMRGGESNSENYSLTTWDNTEDMAQPNKALAKDVLAWLANFSHPRLTAEFSQNLNVSYLTPATMVSGKEMAIQLGLPRRSTSTVTVIESPTFGRQIQNVDGLTQKAEKVVNLGVVRHLWTDLPQKVELDIKKLSSHIFVTGSTGSGKSNTVYQLLSELNKNDVNFMVIEPAKGEYKHVFGHREDVTVLGTNPLQAELLKINPFKFPKGVHVLEHIDRLVEIFNVCWPMYAAMPAVLKDAMLEAYKISGWDLDVSCNLFGKVLFPTFTDLLTQLEKVIQQSAFSEEVKSNYIGSLVTRVKSLTNGLNGQIFASNEIDNALLFDSNVIVDLSRIGSQESKSLIMGILVMRLSEHRMSNAAGMNQPLKHVTVLEEAHNILKRTSTEQSSEGSNVAGKAVEMLSNAIAEMRTYGEGFIIADQSPSAVDISAIRNTNTKIIMRLPDESDRCLAGKASGVTDEQLEEITKLPKGVAVVYQNDWLEPVLCKIHHFDAEEKLYQYESQNQLSDEKKAFHQHIADLLFSQKTKKQLDLVQISKSIEQSKLGVEYKNYFLDVVNRLEQNIIPPILEKDDNYLVDIYQRIIQQQIELVQKDLSVELQQHLANIM
ncbi:MAG: ATP-binding protein [Haemophilus parainfluenzae]|nr:ATP-binding protein [Haemophilus parainfluenzae]